MTNQKAEFDKSLKLIAKSSVYILIGVVFSKIASYFYRVIIARQFGPEIYGLFSLAIMITGWFLAFSLMGLNTGLFRYISFYRGKKQVNKIRHLIKSSSIFLFFTSLIFMVIMFLLSDFVAINIFHNEGLAIFLKFFSIAIPLTTFTQSLFAIILAYEKTGWHTTVFYILNNIIKVGSLVLLIMIGLGTKAIIFSHLLALIAIAFALYFVSKYVTNEAFGEYNLKEKEKKRLTKELFSYSWPFFLSAFIIYLFYWTDSFVIGFFKSVTEVGFYNAAIPISFLLYLAPEIFLRLFFPLVTKEYSRKNFEVIRELSKQVTKWIFILNIPIFLLILLFPSEIISILFGLEYIVAANALRILSFGILISSLLIVSRQLIEMVGKSKLVLVDTLLAAILNIILNIMLVPKYGISGAAFATTVSITFLTLVFMYQANRLVGVIPLRRKMLKIFGAALIPTILLILIKSFILINTINFIVLSLFFMFLYFILILITGALDDNDLFIIKTFLSKIKSRKK